MSSSTLQGYLVLADISGYTSYVAGTELEHSQAILADILHLVVSHLTPTLELAEIEGDAVFAYAPAERFARKETLLELIETTYLRFRNHREFMQTQRSCTCLACAQIPTLDLKFIAHAGSFVMQTVAGKRKPVGTDVILAHRLLKNTVGAAQGWRAYVLLTDRLREEIGLPVESLFCAVEEHEHLGQVRTCSYDLQERYQQLITIRQKTLTTNEVHGRYVMDFPAPPAVVWDWLCSPERRTLCGPTDEHWSGGERPAGRSSVGASNCCDHRGRSSTETIIDWKPFEYYATEYSGFPVKCITTNELIPREGGTRLIWQICFQMDLPPWLRKPIGALINKLFVRMDGRLRRMRAMMEAELHPAETSAHTPPGRAESVSPAA